jgi:mRNA-degrading endonuclease toxin of MazEF toxin-antitoxin module
LQNTIGKRVIIIPLTTTAMPDIPFHVPLEFEGKKAKLLPEQIRSVDKRRVGKEIGEVSEEIMKEVEEMLHILLNFQN